MRNNLLTILFFVFSVLILVYANSQSGHWDEECIKNGGVVVKKAGQAFNRCVEK